MDLLDLTQSFVERCERSAPASELAATFERAVQQIGFRHFACCSHVNPRRPPQRAVVVHNYPREWERSYAERNLHEYDPVFLRAEKEALPFHWDAPDFRAGLTASQEKIIEEAESVGIAHGYTVPIHLPRAAGALHASCSLVPETRAIDTRAYRAVQLMSMYLYVSVGYQKDMRAARAASLESAPVLSARERQCLELAAYGKSDWEISQLLGISEHTVHKHVETAKRRLGVSTRVQAIVWAAQRLEISLGDVVKAAPTTKGTNSRRWPKRSTSMDSESRVTRHAGH
jgi:DNA-binding HTH domain-containing proteins|nr:LuxR family transcriptional regulator [uncultured Steroidobacter sp.]